jgi:hypothetical protein
MLKRFWNCLKSLNKSDSVLLCNACFGIEINSLEDVNRLVFFENPSNFHASHSLYVRKVSYVLMSLGLVPFNLLLRLYQSGYEVVLVGTL